MNSHPAEVLSALSALGAPRAAAKIDVAESEAPDQPNDQPNDPLDWDWDAEWEADAEWETMLPSALKFPAVRDLEAEAANQALKPPTLTPITAQITELIGAYKTCRVRLDQPQPRLFAIQLEQRYYSFSRLLPTRAAALNWANQLSRSAQHVLLTAAEPFNDPPTHPPNNQRAEQIAYGVWLWQPEAQLIQPD